MGKLVFLDIDGTLVSHDHGLYDINHVTRVGLEKLQQNHKAFICTGRTHCFINKEILKYPFDGFVMCNGGYVEYHGQCVYKKTIPVESLQALLDICKEYNFDYFIESYDTIYVNDLSKKRTLSFINRWKMDLETTRENIDIHNIEAYIAMIAVNDESDFPIVMHELENYFDIAKHPNQLSFDLNIKGVNKGTGIIALTKYLQQDIADTIAFGDGNNDIEMIETVGLGVAMGNAVPALKEKSDAICESVLDNGVVKKLEELGLLE